MKNVVLVVSTRDYPFNDQRDNYHKIKASALDEVIEKLSLDEETVKEIKSRVNGKEESYIRAAKRNLCWGNYDHSSWNRQDWYPNQMLLGSIPFFHFALEETNKDTFYIYISPCTNERLDKDAEIRTLKSRAYTEGIIQSAINDFYERYQKQIDKLLVLVHGPDIIGSGSGQVASENLSLDKNNNLDEPCCPIGNIYEKYKDCLSLVRFQHDASDKYYNLIVGPIVNNTLTHKSCSDFLKDLGNHGYENSIDLSKKNLLIRSYKKVLNITE